MPHNNTPYYRGPKRRIEKIVNYVDNTCTDAGVTSDTLHSCEDAKTLVRMIVDLDVIHLNGAPGYQMGIHISPAGSTTWTPGTPGESLDQEEGDTLLLTRQGGSEDNQIMRISIDSKGQRKLKVGDLIRLSTKGDVTNGCKLLGTVTMFFKE